VEKIFEIISTSGPQGGFVAIVLLLLFFIRKQEAGVRTEINGSLQRLQTENEGLRARIVELEDEIDVLRKERRAAEDREDQQRRRAEAAESTTGVNNVKG
jgi:predicted  nucleic acid-binding Zn-ribbon protein